MKKGTEYKEGKLVLNPEKAERDEDVPDDKVTMEVIKDIANEIDDMIIMTVDCPSNHETKRVPMLDVEVWLHEEEEKVFYSFYEKPTKSPYVISKDSAMPTSKKNRVLEPRNIQTFT